MSDDYYTPRGKRKTKKDKMKKKKHGVYKKGGKFRTSGIKENKDNRK
jgi:hypothetical protein